MKIFVSYSSRQKFLVRELVNRLPSSLECWLDEKEILVGDDLDARIETGILDECELFLLVLDDHAAKSAWVRKEIKLVLAKERQSDEPLLLPIVIDKSALDELSEFGLGKRKYLSFPEFDDILLHGLCTRITNEILGKLVRQRSRKTKDITGGRFSKLSAASQALTETATQVRDVLFAYRRVNPMSIRTLRIYLNENHDLGLGNDEQLKILLDQLQAIGLLKGYYHNERQAYLSTERVSTKSDLNADLKRRIGQQAALEIESGMQIGIDGGSTTLELTRELGNLIKAKALSDLAVFTNSVSAAHHLLDVLNSVDAGDKDAICRVTLLGGWCRPVSVATVPPSSEALEALISGGMLPKKLDRAFIGANGVHDKKGFGNTHHFEIPAKRYFSECAAKSVYLLESRKLMIPQQMIIEEFNPRMLLVTDSVGLGVRDVAEVVSLFEAAGGELRACDV